MRRVRLSEFVSGAWTLVLAAALFAPGLRDAGGLVVPFVAAGVLALPVALFGTGVLVARACLECRPGGEAEDYDDASSELGVVPDHDTGPG